MHKLLNKFICILLVLTLIIPSKIVFAEAVPPLPEDATPIFKVIEGGKDSQGIISEYGPTLGYILLAILGIYLVGDTTVAAYEDIQDPTSDFYQTLENEVDPFIKQTWDNWKSQAVWIEDTSISLIDYIAYGNIVEDLGAFIFPVKETPSDIIELTIDMNLNNYIKDYVIEYTGMDGARTGTYDRAYSYWIKALKEYTTNDLSKINIDAEFFKINEGYVRNYYVYLREGARPTLLATNSIGDEYYTDLTYIEVENNYNKAQEHYIRSSTGYDVLYFSNNVNTATYNKLENHQSDLGYLGLMDKQISLTTPELYMLNGAKDIIYSSKPLLVQRTLYPTYELTLQYKRDTVTYTKSDFELINPVGTNKIRIIQPLIDKGNNKIIYNKSDTDSAIEILQEADKIGRIDSNPVVENPIIKNDALPIPDNEYVAEIDSIQKDIFDNFKGAIDSLDNNTNFPQYILDGLMFVAYVFGQIWSNVGDYNVIFVFASTLGVIVLLLGFGMQKNRHDNKEKNYKSRKKSNKE